MKVRIGFPILMIVFSMTLAACGLGAAAAKPSPTPDPQKAALAWAQCMREHGVDIPDPGSNGGGAVRLNADQATMDAAQSACRSKLAGQNASKPTAAEQARMRDALVKFSACMRAHGVNLPDPQFNANGATIRAGGDSTTDPTSAAFQAAQKACQSNLPTLKGSGPSVGIGGPGGK